MVYKKTGSIFMFTCNFLPILWERYTKSRINKEPIMSRVSPLERELYHQKIILLFPMAPVILSSNKQPWEASRHTI